MRKNIDFSKFSAQQLFLITIGFSISVLGLVLSIIEFASGLYTTQDSVEISLMENNRQIICSDCRIGKDQSLWLQVLDRQIEYTDISLVATITPSGGGSPTTEESAFKIINVRNQYDGKVFYRLMSLEPYAEQAVSIDIQKNGTDNLNVPAMITLRTYAGIKVNFIYLSLILMGTVGLIAGLKKPKKQA